MPTDEGAAILEGVNDRLRDVLAPLRDELAQIDTLVEAKREEISELREVQYRIRKVIAAAEGRPLTVKKSPNGKPQSVPYRKNLEKVEDWVKANFSSEDDITARMVTEGMADTMTRDTVRRSIDTLASRGVLRLDRYEKGNPGTPRRVWKLSA
jgi:hypothetical protein